MLSPDERIRNRENGRRWKKNNPEKYKAQWKRANALAAKRLCLKVAMKYGEVCAYCGSRDPWAMQIHHKNADGKEERSRTGIMGNKFYRQLIRGPVRADLELICASCHQKQQRLGQQSKVSDIHAKLIKAWEASFA